MDNLYQTHIAKGGKLQKVDDLFDMWRHQMFAPHI